jgi:adenylate cyclase, class 2
MQNLEAKFRLPDLEQARAIAETIGFVFQRVLSQSDTFFVVGHGKLKLREQSDGASLIHYRRDRVASLDLSHYQIVPVSNPQATLEILTDALGVLSQVRKQRVLLLRNNIRLHLDRVEGLGEFGEIEAVVEPGGSAEAYREEVAAILAALVVRDADLVDVSYFELMRSQ